VAGYPCAYASLAVNVRIGLSIMTRKRLYANDDVWC